MSDDCFIRKIHSFRGSLGFGLFVAVVLMLAVSLPVSAQPTCTPPPDLATIGTGDVSAFDSNVAPQIFGAHWDAQTFTVTGTEPCVQFDHITFEACQLGSPSSLVVEIYATDSKGVPLVPAGIGGAFSPIASTTDLGGATLLNCGHGNGPGNYTEVTAAFSSAIQVQGGTVLAVVFHQDQNGGNGSNAYQIGVDDGSSDLYSGGSAWRNAGSTWKDNGQTKGRDARLLITYVCCQGNPPPPLGSCQNQVGSVCCGLSQGAYGAPKSGSATSLGSNNCNDPGNMGVVPLGACQGFNAFAGLPNQTTIGVPGARSVTVGGNGTFTGTQPSTAGTFPTDLNTLIAYLPATKTPGSFSQSLVPTDKNYTQPNQIPDRNTSLGNSAGQGGGTLSGNTMTCGLNTYFSNNNLFLASGFDQFTLPAQGTLLCTRRSGGDHKLGTSDDICQAFSFPSCAAGATVAQVRQAANCKLANNTSGNCASLAGSLASCSASDLNIALDNVNNEFDQCGQVIDCGLITLPGVFVCP